MLLNIRKFDHIQQWFIILIHQDHPAFSGHAPGTAQQILEPDRKRGSWIFTTIKLFPFLQVSFKYSFECTGISVIVTIEVKVKNRIQLPSIGIFTQKSFNGKPLKTLSASFPVISQSGKQQAFPETSWPAEKILLTLIDQPIDIISFVRVKISVITNTREALYANRKFSARVHLFHNLSITQFVW